MKSWTTIENLGKLRIEQSLIEIDTPLLFVCMDKNKSRYMVMCIDDDEYEYLISRVSNEDIIHLIQTGRGLRSMFTQCSSGVYHVKLTESLEAKRLSKSELTDDILPKKRVRYDFSAQELQRYANSISKSKTVNKTPRRIPTAVKTIKTSNNKTDVFRYPRVAAHSPAIGAVPTRKVSSQKQRPNKKGKK